MELNLKGKSALVTAASSGLGYASAAALAREGVKIAVWARDPERIQRTVSKLKEVSSEAVVGFAGDLTRSEDISAILAKAKESLGPIDIVVLSTGHPPTYPFSKATDDQWEHGYDLILKPVIEITRAVLPDMKERGYGRLIYLGSIFGLEPEKTSVIQSTLRTALNAFSKCVATENAAAGVTANVICPGYFDTPLVHELAKKYAKEESRDVESVLNDWRAKAPSKKFGKAEDLGNLVAFLASPHGEFINGTAVVIDGGAIRQY